MASTIIAPIAAAIKDVADGLSITPAVNGVYPDPGFAGIENYPAFVIGVPELRRVEPDDQESQINMNDWFLSFDCGFICDLDNSTTNIGYLAEVQEAFVSAIDDDRDLTAAAVSGCTIIEASVTSSGPLGSDQERARPILVLPVTVEVYVQVDRS